MTQGTCTICQNTEGNRVHLAREMMWGTGEQFRYLECGSCGSLELLDVPADLSPYYPPDYYSLEVQPPLRKGTLHPVRRLRASLAIRIERVARIYSREAQPDWTMWFRGLGLPDSVLDVGCGSGQLLFNLWQEGFTCLTGCDPYLKTPFDNGDLRLVRATPGELTGPFDVVMAHHSFEHMRDPHGTMEEFRRLARRRIVLRVPVPGFAWREYGVNWIGLDAPRHLHIVSLAGMRQLAEAHGLRVVSSYFEPDSLSLWGSKQYVAGIPLRDSRSYAENPKAMSREEVAGYDRQARDLSAAGDGDVAVFLLARA